MARGRVPKVDEVCRIIETLATYKINHFQLYVEHTFRFRKHPKIGRGASPYSAEDMLRIDRHAKKHFVEFTPSLASFGPRFSICTVTVLCVPTSGAGLTEMSGDIHRGLGG